MKSYSEEFVGTLGPHHLTLCSLLEAYLAPDLPEQPGDVHERLGEALLREIRATGSVTVPSLNSLLSILKASGASPAL
jgi:hypothetical protein